MAEKRVPRVMQAAAALVGLQAVFWLGYAAWLALREPPGGLPTGAEWVMGSLAAGTSAGLAGLAVWLWKGNRHARRAGLVYLALLALLSVTDQFGPADLFTLVTSLGAMGLLLASRSRHIQTGLGGR